MDKILEALKALLPSDQVKQISEAVSDVLEQHKKELEAEYDNNLEEAYADLSKQVKEAEKIGTEGYQEAWAVIEELRNRADQLKSECKTALDQGYEEAYQEILAERGKNDQVGLQMHEEYEQRYQEVRKFVIESMHKFLTVKGKEIYEMARRDIMNDPSQMEHKVVLDKVVDVVNGYITDDDKVLATGSRLEEASKKIDEMGSRVRMLEAKNIRLAKENTILGEQVREAADMLTESTKTVTESSRKVRAEKAKNVMGRGDVVSGKTKVIAEFASENNKEQKDDADTTIVESMSAQDLKTMQTLAGYKTK
jgi:hypothetical protein